MKIINEVRGSGGRGNSPYEGAEPIGPGFTGYGGRQLSNKTDPKASLYYKGGKKHNSPSSMNDVPSGYIGIDPDIYGPRNTKSFSNKAQTMDDYHKQLADNDFLKPGKLRDEWTAFCKKTGRKIEYLTSVSRIIQMDDFKEYIKNKYKNEPNKLNNLINDQMQK
jgi:hypothetical protein